MTREVMQRALDALNRSTPLPADEEPRTDRPWAQHGAAIEALKDALAQPVQPVQPNITDSVLKLSELMRGLEMHPTSANLEPGQLYLIGEAICKQAKFAQPVQPEQEPVAWSYEGWRSGITGQPQWFDEIEFVQPPNNEHFRNIVPLYTSPPQRQPLTKDQVDDLAEEGIFLGSIYEITRAVEAAHDIKAVGH